MKLEKETFNFETFVFQHSISNSFLLECLFFELFVHDMGMLYTPDGTLVCFICYGGGLFDDPLVFVPRAHRCVYSPSLGCFFFGATTVSECTVPRYGRDVIAELSLTKVRLSGAANVWDA